MRGLVLMAGGARGAYQAGVLKRISELASLRGGPSPFAIVAGASAGAINGTMLAAHSADFVEGTTLMAQLWSELEVGHVFRTDAASLTVGGLRWLRDLSLGGLVSAGPGARSLLDATPLRELIARAVPFARIADGREFIVRVYVQPGVLKDHLGDHSDELKSLEADAARAAPGQKYLLERKIENLRRDASRDVATKVAGEVHDRLREASMETVREQPVNSGAPREQGRAVLNASFLVAPAGVVEFQTALTGMVSKYESSGFKFDFTGPWPPYHFVGERSE